MRGMVVGEGRSVRRKAAEGLVAERRSVRRNSRRSELRRVVAEGLVAERWIGQAVRSCGRHAQGRRVVEGRWALMRLMGDQSARVPARPG